MKLNLAVMAVLCLVLLGGGCVLAERASGIHRDPVTGQPISDGTGGIAGNILGILIPGAGAVIAAAAAAYANAKRGQWKNAALSTFEAVEAFKQTPQGASVWSDLKGKLGEKHAAFEIQKFVDGVLKKEAIAAAVAPTPAAAS